MRFWTLPYTLMLLTGCTTTQEARPCADLVEITGVPVSHNLRSILQVAQKGCKARGKCLVELNHLGDYAFHAKCEVLK